MVDDTKARAILHEWVQSDSLRKHCEAVAASMRYFARKHGADEGLWSAVGLLHDQLLEASKVIALTAVLDVLRDWWLHEKERSKLDNAATRTRPSSVGTCA